MLKDCIFCKIVSGEAESSIIYEDPKVIAFLDIHPINPGHILVIPKKHAENIYDVPTKILGRITKVSQELSLKLKIVLHAEGISIFQMNEEAGNQDVMHYHMHIVPRYRDDWFHKEIMIKAIQLQQVINPKREELDSIAIKIRQI